MCEWLSRGEWCDVRLQCGGRGFSAHRAVLASVSPFLRQILLSRPADEGTTVVVLPDFDIEALSSVLFYIYNGEVLLQNHKMAYFLDVIRALRIHVDCQNLPKIKDVTEEQILNIETCGGTASTEIFTLRCGDDEHQNIINIKRGVEIRGASQNAQRGPDHDSVARSQRASEQRRSRLGNLKSPRSHRQRNSFLRDLFVETYPRNGNVNGVTAGVLAISNERYRGPASVLSANANGVHLAGRLSLATSATSLCATDASSLAQSGRSGCTNYNTCFAPTTIAPTAPRINNSGIVSDLTFIPNINESIEQLCTDGISSFSHQLNEKNVSYQLSSTSNFQQSFLDAMKCGLLQEPQFTAQNFLSYCQRVGNTSELNLNISPRVIFNEVLENPWNPRKPNSFRPFRRKRKTSDVKAEEEYALSNDSNNNQTASLHVEDLSMKATSNTSRAPDEVEPPPPDAAQHCFKCSHCDQTLGSSESLAAHARRHGAGGRYSCAECGKTFSQLRNYKYHMSVHRGTREFAATCPVCGKYFNDRGYLSSHMKIHRNRKEYKCSQCPKSFNQRVAYNMHVRIHTGVKPHVCAECGKAFSRKMLLKQHQRTHSGERPYACTHCDKRFADRSNMTLHLRLHTGVKPFSCTLCPKSFTKKHHLKSHLNFHTGSKPYSCPRCGLAFTQSSNMRTHYKKCTAPHPPQSATADTPANQTQTLL